MKIRSDSLDALLRQEQLGKGVHTPIPGGGTEAFSKLLAQQGLLEEGQAGTGAGPLPPGARSGLLDPMLLSSLGNAAGTGSTEETGGADALERTILNQGLTLEGLSGQAASLVDGFANYADSLRSGASARDAWAQLSAMTGSLQNLRQGLSTLAVPNQGLEAVVNELEVLAATETFKLNRGDYNEPL